MACKWDGEYLPPVCSISIYSFHLLQISVRNVLRPQRQVPIRRQDHPHIRRPPDIYAGLPKPSAAIRRCLMAYRAWFQRVVPTSPAHLFRRIPSLLFDTGLHTIRAQTSKIPLRISLSAGWRMRRRPAKTNWTPCSPSWLGCGTVLEGSK